MQIHGEMNFEVKVEKKLFKIKVLLIYQSSGDVQNLILDSRLLFSPCS